MALAGAAPLSIGAWPEEIEPLVMRDDLAMIGVGLHRHLVIA
ncbi:hypothetical protein [Nonomuraea roseoviolacea]|uniref:Uncharacterized protein n=1 Tax=Nonomuraea roseoviolacea subsp. carminata TaxID=160689 RepID=A0ABT1K4G7_9ACTN|nr:hypothetical protein [Nonomuraea roseoviolacea]MCP2348901.1 hypothetical protein [Nonomuraea roseoviolacea subsp. carminata]